MRKFFLLLPLLFLFVGCSAKKYFEPSQIEGYVSFDGAISAKIVDVGRDGATLANGEFISKDGVEAYKLPKNFIFLNKSDGKYIAASKCGKLLVVDAATKKVILKKNFSLRSPIAASMKGTLLAMVFDDDTLMLYDIDTNTTLYTSHQPPDIAVDTKIANPFFLGALVLYPTLDGKMVVVNTHDGKELKTVIVGTNKEFNNIIFLNVIDEKLIAATPNKIVSVSPTFTNSMDVDLSDVLYVKDRVYLLTKDGQIILCDPELNILKSRKYNFAHFVGAIYGEYIYILEKSGYIIGVDKDLRVSNIFKLSNASMFGLVHKGLDEYIFASKDKFFYGDKYFKLNKL